MYIATVLGSRVQFLNLLIRLSLVSLSMAAGRAQQAKRALVAFLMALMAAHNVRVNLTRESSDEDVLNSYKRMLLKVHPDKGGSKEAMQMLQQKRGGGW